MAVAPIAGAWGYLELGREATNKRDSATWRGNPTPFACTTVAIKSSISFGCAHPDIVYQAGERHWIS